MKISVIGAGLAGCEAAWQLANAGLKVDLYEMKPHKYSNAHKYNGFAELVCSNSLKAFRVNSASGLLKHEMEMLGSLIIDCAKQCAVGAGGALAVDREKFSDLVTQKIKSNPNINVINKEVSQIPEGYCIISSGPLTSEPLSESIKELCSSEYLSFFDAAAPIISAESVNMDIAFFAARYNKGDADYINCPMDEQQYLDFYNELINGETAQLKEFEKQDFKVYEGCMPVEVMGKRGVDTLRFGPLKPVGIYHPVTDKKSYAIVQLRKENAEGTMYNLVGFQTNLKFGEQKRIFSMIPSLENAEFIRYGVMHRNTFINSPKLLDKYFRLKKDNNIYFAGQITGVEGYVESAASGIYAGLCLSRQILDKPMLDLPKDTMIGALSNYISDETIENFQPMGSNMGLLPSLGEKVKDKQLRYEKIAQRGITSFEKAIELDKENV